jgi:hypothetical protein
VHPDVRRTIDYLKLVRRSKFSPRNETGWQVPDGPVPMMKSSSPRKKKTLKMR